MLYKILVQPSSNCFRLLSFVSDRLDDLNKRNVYVHFNLVDPDQLTDDVLTWLQNKNISRFPVIIGDDGKPLVEDNEQLVGLKAVQHTLSQHLTGQAVPEKRAGYDESYFNLFFRQNPDTGAIEPRDDGEPEDTAMGDIGAKMNHIQLKKRVAPPRGARAPEQPVDEDEIITRQPTVQSQAQQHLQMQQPQMQQQTYATDNIHAMQFDDQPDMHQPHQPISYTPDDGSLDARMMAALMDKI